MRLYVVSNYWELFVSLILIKDTEKKDYLIVMNNINFKNNETLLKNLSEKVNIEFFSVKHNAIKKFLLYYIRIHYIIPKKIKKYLQNIKEVISFSDQDVITRYFIQNGKEIILYEHGNINYTKFFGGIVQLVKKIIFGMEQPYGRTKSVKEIYLKFPEKAPDDIKDKVRFFDLVSIINSLDKKEVENIYNLFGKDIDIEEGSTVILTQPLEIVGCTIEKKLEIYSEILEEYLNEKIYIKPHPLENMKDYKRFSEIAILSSDFPIELLLLKGKNIKRVVTIYSSSVSSFIGVCDVIFLGLPKYRKFINIKEEHPYEEHLLEK